jgi:hypothetical protein
MKTWQITWGDRTWAEEDLLASHLVLMGIGNGTDDWDVMPTSGPKRLLSTLAAFISLEDERDYLEVVNELLAVPAAKLILALDIVDVPQVEDDDGDSS